MNIRYSSRSGGVLSTTDSMTLHEAYQDRHSAFVSGHPGGTRWEVVLVSFIGPASVLLRNLAVPWIFPARKFNSGNLVDKTLKHSLDFVLLVVPTVLSVSAFSERTRVLLLALLCLCGTLMLLCAYEYLSLFRHRTALSDALTHTVDNPKPMFITYIRSYVFISTTVLILAVDFPVMPRRFAKTESYGYSLMDTGVAAYTLISGMTAHETKLVPKVVRKRVLEAVPLIILGVGRLLMVKTLGYHEHVTEYGVHWNFFFTLACVKLLTTCASCVLHLRKRNHALLLAVTICALYQTLLTHAQLESALMTGFDTSDPRSNLLDANREGVFSLAGYLAIHLCGIHIGVYLQRPRAQIMSWLALCARALVCCLLLLALHLWLHENVGPASRRLANATYVTWTLFSVGLMMWLYLCIEVASMLASAMQLPPFVNGYSEHLQPCLLDILNRRAMLTFVVANLLTGVVNMNVATLDVEDDMQATCVIVAYCFAVTLLVRLIPQRTRPASL